MAEHVPDLHSLTRPLSSAAITRHRAATPSPAIMAVDGDPRMRRYIQSILENSHRRVVTCESAEHALDCMQQGARPRALIASATLSDMSAFDLVTRIRKSSPYTRLVLMAHAWEYRGLLNAIAEGAHDILLKPFRPEDLLELLNAQTTCEASKPENQGTEIPIGRNGFFVLASSVMRELQQQASLVAPVDIPVLILGESGTGKEVLARYIHSLSPQAEHTFLKVNCPAVPSELLESELFGYEPGAFTGATRSKPGKFQQCHNGTIFLDEIGEMHPNLQAKLLQVLQDGSFTPLGGRKTEKVKVRILAATNIDMRAAIAQKKFREDLYYRLNGISLRLPPLRERQEEIPILLNYFLRRCADELGIPADARAISSRLRNACMRYEWPGNLRELESFVKRYLVIGNEKLMLEELRQNFLASSLELGKSTATSISDALRSYGGNRRRAAEALGVSYKVLLDRLRKLGIDSGPQPVAVA